MSAEIHLVIHLLWGCASRRHTVKGVLETVEWRIRDETGVKPTAIGIPSPINHVNKHESYVAVVIYLVGEGYIFQGMGIRGLGDKEFLIARRHFRGIQKAPNHPRKKQLCTGIRRKVLTQ